MQFQETLQIPVYWANIGFWNLDWIHKLIKLLTQHSLLNNDHSIIFNNIFWSNFSAEMKTYYLLLVCSHVWVWNNVCSEKCSLFWKRPNYCVKREQGTLYVVVCSGSWTLCNLIEKIHGSYMPIGRPRWPIILCIGFTSNFSMKAIYLFIFCLLFLTATKFTV